MRWIPMQKAAYEAINEKEMDKNVALRYLKSIKQDAEVLQMADDAKGFMHTYSDDDQQDSLPVRELKRHFKKLDRDVEKLTVTIKAGQNVDQQAVAPMLESLIQRLNILFAEVKGERVTNKASVQLLLKLTYLRSIFYRLNQKAYYSIIR